MPVLALIIAIIGGIGVWWWRAQQVKGAADAALDAAGKARGMINRARFKHRAGTSVLAGVDTPGMAAATLIYSLMSLRRPITLSVEKVDLLHAKALSLGGKDEGAPGDRGGGFYGAYFRDLAGNKLCVFTMAG